MPFRSKAQQKYLFAKEPKVAREFADATPKGDYKTMPEHVGDKKRKKKVGAGQASTKTKTGVGGFLGNLPPQSQTPMSLQGALAGGLPNPPMAAPPVMTPGSMPPLPPGLLGTPPVPPTAKKKPAKKKPRPKGKAKPGAKKAASTRKSPAKAKLAPPWMKKKAP